MTIGSGELLEIVGQLHDGVAEDATWERAVTSVCALLDVRGFLIGAVGRDGSVKYTFSHRAAPQAIALLEGPLADPSHSPWMAVATSHALRRVATVADVGGRQHLESTRLWRDFYVPLGLGDSFGAVLERQPEYANFLMLARRAGQPDFRAADHRALQALLPHIARAWRVKSNLAEMQSLVGSLTSVIDRLERAIVITGPNGEVRFANRSADRLLSRGDAIDARGGRLYAKRSRHSQDLQKLIGRAAATAIGASTVAVDAVALPSEGEHPPLAVVAEPVAPAHGDHLGHGAVAGAILFIGDSEASRCPPAERLSTVYALTPAEAKLASLIVEGSGLARTASVLHISPNTAKYHLKAVFEKVGVSSQAQLVRRVLADVGGLAEPEKLRTTGPVGRNP